MDVVLYQRAQSVFDEVVELPPDERSAAVSAACSGDVALRALVEELLLLDVDDSPVDNVDALLDEAAEAVARPPSPLQPGATVDRYVALRLLGLGGTAQVWEVRHQTLESHHALKVLTWAEPSLQRRLLREGRAQAQLDHENLVPVHDVVDVNGAPGLLMPLVLGPALDELLVEQRPTRAESLALVRAIADGVGHAHALGFAHRDLKPGNVLIDLRGQRLVPRVADFGLVKGVRERTWTRPGAVMGTLSYASPEQLMDTAGAGQRADLWSLGVILYELLAGTRPFRGRSLGAILEAHEAGPSLAPIPVDLRPVVSDLLRPDPDQRLPDCATLLARLPDEGGLRADGALGRAAAALAEDRASRRPTVLPAGAASEATLPPVVAAPATPAPLPAAARAAPAAARPWLAIAGVLALGGALWWGISPPSATEPPGAGDPLPEATAPPEAASPLPVGPAPGAPDGALPEVQPALGDAAGPAGQGTDPAPGSVARGAGAPPTTAPETPAPRSEAPPTAGRPDPPVEAARLAPAEPGPTEATPAVDPPEPPEPETAPDPAVVTIDGETQTARLISADGRLHAPGAVPPGRYRMEAKLPGRQNWVDLDLGELRSGQVLVIRCDGRFGDCQVKP